MRYVVSHNGEVKGPFDLDMIEAFILSGHYPKDVRICPEGTDDWKSHAPATATPTSAPLHTAPRSTNKPPRTLPKWPFWVGGLIVLWIIGTSSRGTRDTASASRSSAYLPTATPYRAYAPAASSSAPRPSYSTPVASSGFDPFKAGAEPLDSAALPSDVLYKGANGRTYRVPHSAYLRLSRQRAAIDAEEAAITAIQAKQRGLSDRLETERSFLDRTDEFEVDAFNDQINDLNTARIQLKRRIDAFNTSVDAFNAELERVGTPER